jgi:hypothetical protein
VYIITGVWGYDRYALLRTKVSLWSTKLGWECMLHFSKSQNHHNVESKVLGFCGIASIFIALKELL